MQPGQPSETARRVAAQRLDFDRVPAPFGDPSADERLAADVAGPLRGTTGALTAYLAARTRFFDTVVVRALERGVTQVVIGAAGFDGRALRYGNPGVTWFELDLPATQQDKRRRLASLGIPADHIRFVPADFDRDEVDAALLRAGLDLSVPSLFLLEGVAVYLERSTLESVMRQFRAVAAPASRLGISLSVSGGSVARAAKRQAFRAAVAALGEPARTSIPPEQVAALFESTGWRVAPDTDSSRAAAAGLVIAETAPG